MSVGIEIIGGGGNIFRNVSIDSKKGVVIDGVEVTNANIGDLDGVYVNSDKCQSEKIASIKAMLERVSVNGIEIK